MPNNITQIPAPRVDLLEPNTSIISRQWFRYFNNINTLLGNGTGVIPVIAGGTGVSTTPTNGQLLIGNGTGYTLNTLAVNNGISIVNGLGTITLDNTGVLSNIAGAGISVSSATGNVIINNTGVLSFSGGTTGLTPAATATGVVTLAGTLGIANGGTNTTATPTAYGVAYGTGAAYAFTAAGTAKQALLANTGSAPTWSTLTSGASILYGDGLGGFSNVTLGSGISFAGGTLSATGSGGTVTSVTGTSPVVSSGGTTPAISLAVAYGDTLNPYASKTANYVLASPNGLAGAPTFRALVAADVPGSALTKTDDTNVTLTLGGSPTTALLNATSLTLGWAGQLNISRGGTNTSTAPSAYGVVYGNSGGTAYTSLTNGTTGQVLTATTGGAPTWAAPATSGTVTSVAQSFTGGLISVAGSPITSSGTLALTVAGTSGGIPYFSSANTWATSAALTLNSLVIGGGAGAAPATTATGTGVVTALGVNTGTAGAFVVNGGALGTPSSGTVTNLTGTASININGTVGATTANTGAFTSLSYTTTLTGGTGIIAIGTNQFYKDASGNIGIGNASPGFKLDVTGQGRATTGFAVSTDGSTFTPSGLNAIPNYGVGYITSTSQVVLSGFGGIPFYTNQAERMRIDQTGNAQFQSGAIMPYAPAPTTISAATTLTNAQIQGQIINTTGTLFTLTMPLGTTLETLASWVTTNIGYDFFVVNTATGIITMAVNTGVTSLGLLTVAAATSAHFRIRRTAANTFVFYRLN